MEPYESLANAIVMRAAKDYRIALLHLQKRSDDKDYQSEAESLERFFRSSWYDELTRLNAEYLIRRINEEVRRSER